MFLIFLTYTIIIFILLKVFLLAFDINQGFYTIQNYMVSFI